MTNPSTESNIPQSEVAQEPAAQTQSAAPGGAEQDGAAPRPRGRKLRTPFRRRRNESAPAQAQGDAAPADQGSDVPLEPMDEAATAAAEQDAEQALAYLGGADRSEQRLGKYLNSDLLMPKLH